MVNEMKFKAKKIDEILKSQTLEKFVTKNRLSMNKKHKSNILKLIIRNGI